MTAMPPIQCGRNLPLAPTGVVFILKKELRVINTDPNNQREKDLISIPTPRGETMWVHLDIVESQQWMTVTKKKSKGKAKASSNNVVGISIGETEEDVISLTSSREEELAFAADIGAPPTLKTRSGKQYLKQYCELMVDSPSQLRRQSRSP